MSSVQRRNSCVLFSLYIVEQVMLWNADQVAALSEHLNPELDHQILKAMLWSSNCDTL